MPTCPFCSKLVPDQSSVCPHCLRAQPAATAPVPRTTGAAMTFMHGRWRLALLALALVAVAVFFVRRRSPEDGPLIVPDVVVPAAAPVVAQTTIAAPIDVSIADTASVRIEGGQYLAFPFSGDGRSGCRVSGSVRALAGGDRRVNVFVVDRDGVAELEAGRPPRTYYESGPVSDVSLGFNLDGRTAYTLVVANTAPRARAKTVRLAKIAAACTD